MSVITEFTGVDDIEDTDLLLVQNSQTVGFKMTGLKYKKLHDIIIASSLTVTGPKIHAGSSVRIYFNTDIAGANTSTAMVINYNNTNITVKAPKDGSLIDYTAKAVGNSYLYCQAYTTLELLYDGTNFVIIGNPVVISNADYTIYTDGKIEQYFTGNTRLNNGLISLSITTLFNIDSGKYTVCANARSVSDEAVMWATNGSHTIEIVTMHPTLVSGVIIKP